MPDTFYAMRHFMDVIGKKAAYPPLGLLTIAAMLPGEWEKRVLDLNVRSMDDADLQWADYVFLSAMNVQEESAREVIARCNELGVKIVAGGTLFTHEYTRFDGVDHFVLNEAEITLPWFLEDMADGKPKPIYKSSEYADIEQSPLPAFELVDMSQYLYAIVQYSRGCPYMCDFCDVTALLGRRPRVKKPEQIIAELEAINKSGNTQLVLFADDNLIGNKRVLKSDLLPALIAWRKKNNPQFYFATQLTINLADDEDLMQLMLDAGFRHVFIGVETPSEESLKASRKNQNLKRNLMDTIHEIHGRGFIISAGFIVGFDTDDESIFRRQIQFIQESGIPLPIVNILKAPPGTELYTRIKFENRLSKPFAFTEGDTNVVPMMDETLLFGGFIDVIDHIYTPAESYKRLMKFFETYRFPKSTVRIRSTFDIAQLKILWRVVYRLGIRDSNRKYFWKLVGWALRNNHKMLDKAVFYSIMIYQMHMTYKTIHSKAMEELQYFSAQPVRPRPQLQTA
ncbi:MAG: B12-binding domain-containing radical SAM protein [Chitinophagaceae bacterium]|nr:B12-binding domain-containing radical SAM protein [Chitinophagaceae bacterium]